MDKSQEKQYNSRKKKRCQNRFKISVHKFKKQLRKQLQAYLQFLQSPSQDTEQIAKEMIVMKLSKKILKIDNAILIRQECKKNLISNLVQVQKIKDNKHDDQMIIENFTPVYFNPLQIVDPQNDNSNQILSQSQVGCLSEEEARHGLFYFEDSHTLKLIHLEKDKPKTINQKKETFFHEGSDQIKKTREAFAFINIEIMNEQGQLELRHLVMGLRKGCKQIFEFDRKKNTEHILFEANKNISLSQNSAILVYKNQIIITGGEKINNKNNDLKASNQTLRFYISINKDTQRIELQHDPGFPQLKKARAKHSTFLVNDHLFVMFGNLNGYEFYDLKRGGEEFTFVKFIENYHFIKPLIIPSYQHKEQEETKMLILGEKPFLRTRSRNLQFYEMIIKLQDNQGNLTPSIVIEERFQGPEIECNFSQNYPTKKYYPNTNEWYIINEKGEYFILDLRNNLVRN
ncbi:UNKNOWN [Stylonychia lemnae]|uniref:Kelch motif family protein n=1 Tax=Stylonychia lemnae TaxID=5949 RepID=A0A078A679_STYLE|nr:UNKNOWN [Stylonychia lemnae]|eukprot:CDW77709.1 UNKNOWN [Stylonychia lemnae]